MERPRAARPGPLHVVTWLVGCRGGRGCAKAPDRPSPARDCSGPCQSGWGELVGRGEQRPVSCGSRVVRAPGAATGAGWRAPSFGAAFRFAQAVR